MKELTEHCVIHGQPLDPGADRLDGAGSLTPSINGNTYGIRPMNAPSASFQSIGLTPAAPRRTSTFSYARRQLRQIH